MRGRKNPFERPVVTTFSFSKVAFGFLSTDEVREMSVVKITESSEFDLVGMALPNGLYDAMMGPTEGTSACALCCSSFTQCPGHYGHIELAAPCVHPLLIKETVMLLRSHCTGCGHFKIPSQTFRAQMELLLQGDVVGAAALIKPDDDEERAMFLDVQSNIHLQQLRKQLISKFFKAAAAREKCTHCKVASLKVRSQGPKIFSELSTGKMVWLTPTEARQRLERLWEKEGDAVGLVWSEIVSGKDSLKRRAASHGIFFIEALPVPPNKYRAPYRREGKVVSSHSSHEFYKRIIEASRRLITMKADEEAADPEQDVKSQIVYNWQDMQVALNELIAIGNKKTPGIKSALEKKDGLFRMNLMGKRLNYACRSVISPDPYIATDEIGIPLVFATRLTFPERVTSLNYEQMAQAVRNGPDVHPGALVVQQGDSFYSDLRRLDQGARDSLAEQLLNRRSIVYRHLVTGDYVIANRQPTLHRPSMMGHRARVLPGEQRVIRLHYANCNSYNADFDGDEMNVHFPQDHMARTEIAQLMMAGDQFLVPKDGTPLRGLIQDHILAGVLLTMKDTFVDRSTFQQLLYSAVSSFSPHLRINIPLPALFKPRLLWTGKQLISAVMHHLLRGRPKFNYEGKTRLKGSYWGPTGVEEDQVIFRGASLLQGILDKAQLGASANGFVHTCFSLYGGNVAEQMLTAFARLLTAYLQRRGYTVGVEDLLLTKQGERARALTLSAAHARSVETASRMLEQPNLRGDALRGALAHVFDTDAVQEGRIDLSMKKVANELTTTVNADALPGALRKAWPLNNFLLMVATGAKGSLVNFGMISGLLGQIELEGRRVPLTQSGRTLPSFMPHEPSIRSRGFIANRFLDGIPPQEYFFHSMAGREGLVDTAVKTASSGYLQRCLIKHLESLTVRYDDTVRESGGAVVQLSLGGDGLSPILAGGVYHFRMLADNQSALLARLGIVDINEHIGRRIVTSPHFEEKLSEFVAQRDDLGAAFCTMARLNYRRCLAPAGEAAGLLAAQSLGEPSTQMTLNTFHLAGLGAVNVTLGIPRLRELLMTAQVPKTPVMYVPFLEGVSSREMTQAQDAFADIKLHEIVSCYRTHSQMTDSGHAVQYRVVLEIDERFEQLMLTWKSIVESVVGQFTVVVARQAKKVARQVKEAVMVQKGSDLASNPAEEDGAANEEAEDAEEEEDDGEDLMAAAPRGKAKNDDEEEDDDEDENDEDDDARGASPASLKKVRLDSGFKFEKQRKPVGKWNEGNGYYVFIEECFSSETERQIDLLFSIPIQEGQVLIQSLVEECARSFSVRRCPKISRAVLDAEKRTLTLEGANIYPVWANPLHLDLTRITCNDVKHVLEVYGVEAARATLVHEVISVFKVYGISIDDRHISLVADFMMFEGGYRGFNRNTMKGGTSSSLAKMSFEQTMAFLLHAAQSGEVDYLESVSASVAMGQLAHVGVGASSILAKVPEKKE